MKFTSREQIDGFLEAIQECKGDVYLESAEGDRFNLKSQLSMFIGIGRLLEKKGDELELFATNKTDEAVLLKFLCDYPVA